MNKTNVKLIPTCTAMVIGLTLFACSSKKQEGKKEEPGKMEMVDTKAVGPAPDPIKVFENVDLLVRNRIKGFVSDYFAINQALIVDNQDGAKAAAKKLSETISKFDMSELKGEQIDFYRLQLAKLTQSLKGISESTDIEEARMELAALSEGVYNLVKAYHPIDVELYYQFCPMAKNGEGANWLSGTKEIVNPYMGQRMPHCVRTQETIN